MKTVLFRYPEASEGTKVSLRHVKCPLSSYAGNGIHHILRCQYESYPPGQAVDHSQDLAVECSKFVRRCIKIDHNINYIFPHREWCSMSHSALFL